MKLKKDELRPYEFDSGVYIGFFVDQEEAKQTIKQILQDQKLREFIEKSIENLSYDRSESGVTESLLRSILKESKK